jgi:hypothetical protein
LTEERNVPIERGGDTACVVEALKKQTEYYDNIKICCE